MDIVSDKQERPSHVQANVASVLRKLAVVWLDFEAQLETVPLIAKLYRGAMRMEDYHTFLCNHRQQVVDGGLWISRAASNVSEDHMELRSRFMRHAVTEHRDYRMLERDYVSVGGDVDVIHTHPKNIGAEALSAWMFHRASQPNPFGLLGALFIIEGLGERKAAEWGGMIRDQLNLCDDQVSFLLYHGEHDQDHLQDFEDMVAMVADDDAVCEDIVKTAKVTARLYRLQLEESGNV